MAERSDAAEGPPAELSAIEPPAGFVALMERLEDAGFEAWAVGGALRDAIHGGMVEAEGVRPRRRARRPDWDVATDARPEEVMSLFPRTVPLGVDHGTVGVLQPDGVVYETTTFRLDVETDGRHAEVRFADSIEDDLSRRDFTINAMAWRLRSDEFRDPFYGRDDLEAGILRAVGDPEARFGEDYLRVLRGLRFAGRFDMEIDPETSSALLEAVPATDRLSAERIREELLKVLSHDAPSTSLDLYAESGLLEIWFEEIAPLASDVPRWRSHLAAVDGIAPHRELVRLARLLAPVHEDSDRRAELADAMLERLRFSNAERRTVARLVAGYTPFVSPLDSAAQIRAWLSQAGDAWRDLFRLHMGAARMRGDERSIGFLVAAWRLAHDEVLEGHPLALGDLAVDGSDIIDLGVAPGPIVGLMLEELLAQVLEDPDRNEREALLAEARRLIEIGALAGSPGAEGGSGG